MIYPHDLPNILFYRVGKTVRVTLPRRPVSFHGGAGITDAPQVCPQVPPGADAWSESPIGPWRPLTEVPPEWRPFLNRARGSEMDPRTDKRKD